MIRRPFSYVAVGLFLLRPLSAQEPGSMPPTFWAVGATDADAPFSCLTLASDSIARFSGTHSFLNPARWHYDSATGVLALSLSHLDTSMVATFREAIGKRVLAFDTLSHTVSFNIRLGATLWILGSTLFPEAELDSDEVVSARRICRLGPTR
jgi:hypothetical protein